MSGFKSSLLGSIGLFFVSCFFVGWVVALIITIAYLISCRVFHTDASSERDAKINFLTVIIAMWIVVIMEFIFGGNLAMLGFALPLTIIFIILLVKNTKEKVILPLTKFEENAEIHIKQLDKINIISSICMLGLIIISFFLIRYSKLDDGMIILLFILQLLLLLLTAITFYRGAFVKGSNENEESWLKKTKIISWVSIFLGNIYGFGILSTANQLKKQGIKINVRRWSTYGFYVALIVLLPFLSSMFFYLKFTEQR